MIIFEENGKIRLQLMNLETNTMLFDFTVKIEEYDELKNHIISYLEGFQVKE